jgi:hypothetical protein
MQPLTVFTRPGVEVRRSRQLIQDSRALLASAKEVLQQARQGLARQRYRQIVCAWCARTLRWQRCEEAARGQVSHSICFDCFAGVFQELAPGTAMPLGATRGAYPPAPRGHKHA